MKFKSYIFLVIGERLNKTYNFFYFLKMNKCDGRRALLNSAFMEIEQENKHKVNLFHSLS